MHQILTRLVGLLLLPLLVACGGATTPTASPPAAAPTTAAEQEPASTPEPTESTGEGQDAPATPTTAAPAAPTAEATADAQDEPPLAQVAGFELPQGRTAEGYPFIGQADAPVTLQFFSDFY